MRCRHSAYARRELCWSCLRRMLYLAMVDADDRDDDDAFDAFRVAEEAATGGQNRAECRHVPPLPRPLDE